MWFRIFVVSWPVALLGLLGWLATHTSSEPVVLGRYSPGYFTLLLGIAAVVAVSLLAQRPVLYRRLQPVRREIVLTLTSILLSLILVEAAIRVLDPLGVSYFEESSRYHLDMLADPVLVFRHAPGLRQTYQGVRVSINELGLRDRKLEMKDEGELRILLLGDSVTFGSGVPIEATFGRRLESTLASKLGRPVRTVNAGVGGYNTLQERAALEKYADVIEPAVVILLYVNNDIEAPFDPWSTLSLRDKSPPEAIEALLWKSWLYRLGRFASRFSRSNGPVSLDKNARGVRDSMRALSEIAIFCRDRGFYFVTFVYRTKGESPAGVSPLLLSEIQAIGSKHGFPVGDTAQWWGVVDIRSVTKSTIDSHPNELGHEILAAGMADFLMTQGLANEAARSLETGPAPRVRRGPKAARSGFAG